MAVETISPNHTNLFSNPDLFDDGASDSSGGESSPNRGLHAEDKPSELQQHGGMSDTEETEKNKRKKKKKTPGDKVHKLRKSDLIKMHSETQRMIRESTVNLPKYQPKVKTLDSFLSRLTQQHKKPDPKALKPTFNNKENSHPEKVLAEEDHLPQDEQTRVPSPAVGPSPSSVPHPAAPPPVLHSFDTLEMTVETKSQVTPIEDLKRKFVKHATFKPTNHKIELKVKQADDSNTPCILSQDEVSQHGLAPGAIRQRLKQKLQKELSKTKSVERKRMEEMKKMDNEEMDSEMGELSELEARLTGEDSLSEGSGEEEEEGGGEWRIRKRRTKLEEPDRESERNEEEEEAVENEEDEDSNDSDGEEGDQEESSGAESSCDEEDDDEVYFVPGTTMKRARVIDSDEESSVVEDRSEVKGEPLSSVSSVNCVNGAEVGLVESESYDTRKTDDPSCDQIEESFDLKQEYCGPKLSRKCSEEASMEPLVFTGTLDRHESLDFEQEEEAQQEGPSNRFLMNVMEDSQLTELALEEDDIERREDDFDMSYQIGPSLPPPHQIPRVAREESDELFLTTPSITRQSSTVSDKDVLRGLEAHPDRPLTQINSGGGLIDEETQFLDADGFLCIRNQPKLNSPFSAISKAIDPNSSVPPTSQLLALCSGSFKSSKKQDGQFCSISAGLNTQDNASEVIGLCSGVFPSATGVTQSFRRESGSSDEEEENDMPQVRRRRVRKRQCPTKSERLKEFVESEAELSGSDVGEDENEGEELGTGEEEDSYEDEGEGSDVPLSDTELRNQVNNAHMKQLVADDKAEIRDIQERFLLEGDLYEDGLQMRNGFFRTRRFAHGSEASLDLFAEDRTLEVDMEEEGATLGSQAEAKRRKERLEREEFIKRSNESCNSLLQYDEDSQSILELIKETSNHSTPSAAAVSTTGPIKSTRRGSFLKHKTQTLLRLASVTSTPQGLGGRGFVFQTGVSEPEQSPGTVKNSGGKPPKKKPCLNKSISLPTSTSIFDALK